MKHITVFSLLTFCLLTLASLNANQTLLFESVKKGDLEGVQQALEQGADLFVLDEQGVSALHWAIFHDHVNIVSFLLKKIELITVPIVRCFITENKCGWAKILFFKHNDIVRSAVFSHDGTKILTASKDRTAVLWDLQGNKLKIFRRHYHFVNSAVFSPDDNKILTASSDNTAVLWDLAGNKLRTFKHNNVVNSAVFSPDGNKVLTTSRDNTAVLWDLHGNNLATFQHNRPVNSAVFSPDGATILTTSGNYTAVLWDLNGNKLATFQHNGYVNSAVFSPDGTKVLTTSNDNNAILWNLGGTVIDLAVRQATQCGNTNALKILLDSCDTLEGRCSNTLLHGLCHEACKAKVHNPELYNFLCNVLQLILYKKRVPLFAQDANGLTPIDLANNYNLNEFVTRMILVLLLHPHRVLINS